MNVPVKARNLPWVAVALVAAGAFLRLFALAQIPPALFRDEAEKAYTAYSLLLTGRDLQGHVLPLFINVFGVTTSAIYQYAAVPFVALLGLNEWSARLPAACVGIATLIANFLFMRRAYGKESALWATTFLALSPWHIVFSRWAQQGIFLPLLLICAFWSWRSFMQKRKYGLVLSALCFGLAIYAYDVARLFVPLLGGWMVLVYRRQLLRHWRASLIAALVFLVAVSPVAYLLLFNTSAAQARFRAISILGESGPSLQAAKTFVANYVSHLSPSFLLLHGDAEPRHSAGVGVLSATEFLALILGVFVLLTHRTRPNLVWLGWLLLFPLAASMTRVGVPHALRSIVALPAVQDVAGLGVAYVASQTPKARRKTFHQGVLLATILASVPFAYSYFGGYKASSAPFWQYGVKQSLEILRPYQDKVDRVVFYNVTGAEYLVCFYAKLPPALVQEGRLASTKYAFAPFNYPLEKLYASAPGAVAYVTLPFYPGPPSGRVIPLIPPGGKEPAAVLFLSKPLAERLTSTEKSHAATP